MQDQIQRDEKTDTLQRAPQLHSGSQICTPAFSPPRYSLPAASYIFTVVTATDSISPAMCSSAHANNSYRSLLSNPTNFTAPWQNSREGQLQRSINKEHENL